MERETQFKRCPGSLVFMQPKPEAVPCAACGAETEIWSDEAQGVCPACGAQVVRFATNSCVDWCRHARECLGEDKYKKYGAMKAAMRKHALLRALEGLLGQADERLALARKTAGYAELILAEEPAADPNVVLAAAVMRHAARQGPGPAPAEDCSCTPGVRRAMEELGYHADFIKEVCAIVEGRPPKDDLNFGVVHDAELLASSEKGRHPSLLTAEFLASFRTDPGRRLALQGVLIAGD